MANIPNTYYVVCDYGKLGRETIIDWENCSKQAIILGLIRGEYTRPLEVHCIDHNDGTWRNVSEDIAQDIIDNHRDETASVFEFLEEHLGVRAMADFEREVQL